VGKTELDAPLRAKLRAGLAELAIAPSPEQDRQLTRYILEIELWNDAYGLVGETGETLIVKHILDSLAPLSAVRAALEAQGGVSLPCADAGSGAGLPGIPLAIFLPGTPFTLIERMGKRCLFLENQIALLGLKNVKIQEREIGKAKGPFNLICFRAFRPLEEPITSELLRLLAPGGCLAAYKGRREAIEVELRGVSPELKSEIIPIKVPFLDEERHLVLIRR
jgi:16S rRNA (guanine527-N7)-methyltransferase